MSTPGWRLWRSRGQQKNPQCFSGIGEGKSPGLDAEIPSKTVLKHMYFWFSILTNSWAKANIYSKTSGKQLIVIIAKKIPWKFKQSVYRILNNTSIVWTHATMGLTVFYYLISFFYNQRQIWNVSSFYMVSLCPLT